MDTLTLIAFTTIILLIIGGITAVNFASRQQAARLQKKRGREQKNTVRPIQDKNETDSKLPGYVKHAASLNLIPLTGEQTAQYMTEWEALKAGFEEEPVAAVQEAEHLIRRAMHAKGYSVESYNQLIAGMSVNYPDLVTSYQALHDIATRSTVERFNTEVMHRAMRDCQELIEAILEIEMVEKRYEKA